MPTSNFSKTPLSEERCDFCGSTSQIMRLVRKAQFWCQKCVLPTDRTIYTTGYTILGGIRLA